MSVYGNNRVPWWQPKSKKKQNFSAIQSPTYFERKKIPKPSSTFLLSIKKPPSQCNRVKNHASPNAYYRCFMHPGQSHRQSTPHNRVHTSSHASFSYINTHPKRKTSSVHTSQKTATTKSKHSPWESAPSRFSLKKTTHTSTTSLQTQTPTPTRESVSLKKTKEGVQIVIIVVLTTIVIVVS